MSVNTERLWKGKVCAQTSTSDLLKNFMDNGAATGTENLKAGVKEYLVGWTLLDAVVLATKIPNGDIT